MHSLHLPSFSLPFAVDFSWDYTWHAFLFAYLCWLLFLAIMNLKRAKDAGTISKPALFLGYPALAVGLVLDVLVNVCVYSIIILDIPKELLTTAHLDRTLATYKTGWRRAVALWICRNLLDTFDPSGPHCKSE